jgi:hypothetical protein
MYGTDSSLGFSCAGFGFDELPPNIKPFFMPPNPDVDFVVVVGLTLVFDCSLFGDTVDWGFVTGV